VSEATPPTGPVRPAETTTTSSSTTTTTTTGTGSSPAGRVPASTPAGGAGSFDQGRVKVIGIILALVLLAGALGGIAGVAFDQEPTGDDDVLQPGQSSSGAGSLGNSVMHKSMLPRGARLHLDDTSSPTPVGSATPDSTGSPSTGTSESASPSESTPASPTASPTDGGDNSGGSAATLEGTGVQVYVPPGWQVDGQDEAQLIMSDHQANFAWAYADSGYDPSSDAGTIIAQNQDFFFPPENYTQFQAYDIQPIQPYASVVSIAAMHYDTMWVDDQGSLTLHGVIYVAVRQDGTLLIMTVEHTPAEDWDNRSGLDDIINATYNAFGGVG